jgi:hypothetical protein
MFVYLYTTNAVMPHPPPRTGRERNQWSEFDSPFDSKLGRLLAQEDTSDPRLAVVDARIAEIDRERSAIRLTGPVIVSSIGAGILVGGVVGVAAVKKRCDDAKDDPSEDCDEDEADTLKLALGIVAGIGGVMTLVGGISIISRTGARSRLDKEKDNLRNEPGTLIDTLASGKLGSRSQNGNPLLTMSFDF